jgi:hypothetical protein
MSQAFVGRVVVCGGGFNDGQGGTGGGWGCWQWQLQLCVDDEDSVQMMSNETG